MDISPEQRRITHGTGYVACLRDLDALASEDIPDELVGADLDDHATAAGALVVALDALWLAQADCPSQATARAIACVDRALAEVRGWYRARLA
jgi:hypothetical protein